jgi:CheY-like chemotaxis protein
MDIGLPLMDGYEVARRIHQQADCDGIKLIALTGWGQEEDRRRVFTAGFDHHLVKPVETEILLILLQG